MHPTITLPEELHARIRRAAAEYGRTTSALVTDALRAALDERDARQVARGLFEFALSRVAEACARESISTIRGASRI